MTYQAQETKDENKKGIQVDLMKMLEMAKVSDKLIMPIAVVENCHKDDRVWVLTDMSKK